MIEEWKQFLKDAGAVIENDTVTSFGNPDREVRVSTTGGIVADLSHFGLLRVDGPDAQKFLHAQTINDVLGLDDAHARFNGYCLPNGRLIATFLMFRHDGSILLRLPRSLVEIVKKRLTLYALNARVEFSDMSDRLLGCGYSSPDAEAVLASVIGEIPQATGDVVRYDGITVIRVAGPHARFELTGPADRLKPLWSALDVTAAPVGAPAWDRLNILAGLPIIYPATSDQFLPQMVNLDLIGGVSFKKGCYPGQEIIARAQHRGQVKRRMYLAHTGTDDTLRPGDPVYAREDDARGAVVDARRAPGGGNDLLVVVPAGSFKKTTWHAGDKNGPPIEYRPLPYAVGSDSPG